MTEQRLSYTNEEDLKLKVLAPFLAKLGIDQSELSFERSFTIKLGRHTYQVDSGKQLAEARPRLDVLFTRGGKNLFLVEVKAVDEKIHDAAIKQAASYACLLDQVPPFCVVTNGIETKIVDPVKKQAMEIDELRFDEGYQPSIDEELRNEALRIFLGYSEGNLLMFCRAQATNYMQKLVGGPNDRTKKYIPELYVLPDMLNQCFDEFTASAATVFLLVGPSGSGKTCFLCDRARKSLTEDVPTLFYLASDLQDGFLTAIGGDLNWSLSPQYSVEAAVKRLLEVFRDREVRLFVDGLETLPPSFARREMELLMQRLGDKKVRLIASIKPDTLSALLESDGVPTRLTARCFIHNDRPAVQMPELEGRTFSEVIDRYRGFYRFDGIIEPQVLLDAKRNPFFLRVCFEVASSEGSKAIAYREGFQVFERYLKELLRVFDAPDTAEAMLREIARMMYETDTASVSIEAVRERLGMPSYQGLDDELFRRSLLLRSERGLQGKIEFYFDRLRDFIIAFRVLKLHELQDTELQSKVQLLRGEQVQSSVRDTFYLLCSDKDRRRIDLQLYNNMVAFVEDYEQLLNENFPAFRREFDPHAEGTIGVGGYIDLGESCVDPFGFRIVHTGEDRVMFFPSSSRSWWAWRHGGMGPVEVYGARSLRFRAAYDGFRRRIPRALVAEHEVKRKLKEIIEQGRLNESKCRSLLEERVIAVAAKHLHRYVAIRSSYRQPRLPVSLESIRRAVLVRNTLHRLEHEHTSEMLQRGVLKPMQVSDDIEVLFISRNAVDVKRLLDQARNESQTLRSPTYPLDPVEHCVWNDLDALTALGCDEITESFIIPYDNIESATGDPAKYWKTETKRATVVRLYDAFLSEYTILVKHNFPTLAKHFDLFTRMPVVTFIELSEQPFGWSLRLNWVRSKDERNSVRLLETEHPIKIDRERKLITVDGEEFEWYCGLYTGIDTILSPYESFTPIKVESGWCPLRALVYDQLKRELKKSIEML